MVVVKVSEKVCCLWWRFLAQAPIMLIFETMIAKNGLSALVYRFYLISTPALTCISFLPSKRVYYRRPASLPCWAIAAPIKRIPACGTMTHFSIQPKDLFQCLVDQRKIDIVADSLLLLSFIYSLEALASKKMRQTWAVGVWRKMPRRCQRVRGQVGWRP